MDVIMIVTTAPAANVYSFFLKKRGVFLILISKYFFLKKKVFFATDGVRTRAFFTTLVLKTNPLDQLGHSSKGVSPCTHTFFLFKYFFLSKMKMPDCF